VCAFHIISRKKKAVAAAAAACCRFPWGIKFLSRLKFHDERPPARHESRRRRSFHLAANYYASNTDFSLSPGASSTFNVVTTKTGMCQICQQQRKMLISLQLHSVKSLSIYSI
jgi:hypothetical protein